MNFNIDFDPKPHIEAAKSQIDTACKNTLLHRIQDFFGERSDRVWNEKKQEFEFRKEVGIGLKHIDDGIADRFLDPRFQAHLDKFFDENWEQIYKECMTRALQHKANGVAFNRVHDLTLNGEKK